MNQIYFDNGSTSWPKAPGVPEAMADLLAHGAFNINRGNYEGAYEIESVVLDTREQLTRLFHVKNSKGVVFTPSVTYSLNLFIKGFLKPGDHVIVTGLEHNAVMRPLEQMKAVGVDYDIARTDRDGNLDLEHLKSLIGDSTRAVLVTHASNVCGTVVPIEEIGKICQEHDLIFAVDTAQTAGTLDIDMENCGIDFPGVYRSQGTAWATGNRWISDIREAGSRYEAVDCRRHRKPVRFSADAGEAAG